MCFGTFEKYSAWKNKTSGPFRIPGFDNNAFVQRTGMSSTSVVAFLSIPLHVNDLGKKSGENAVDLSTTVISPFYLHLLLFQSDLHRHQHPIPTRIMVIWICQLFWKEVPACSAESKRGWVSSYLAFLSSPQVFLLSSEIRGFIYGKLWTCPVSIMFIVIQTSCICQSYWDNLAKKLWSEESVYGGCFSTWRRTELASPWTHVWASRRWIYLALLMTYDAQDLYIACHNLKSWWILNHSPVSSTHHRWIICHFSLFSSKYSIAYNVNVSLVDTQLSLKTTMLSPFTLERYGYADQGSNTVTDMTGDHCACDVWKPSDTTCENGR